MLSGAVTGSSSSAAGSGTGFIAERGLTAASVSLRGVGAASAALSAGLAAVGAAKVGFGLGIGIVSNAVVGNGAADATFGGVTTAEDCLSGVTATSGGE